MSVTKEQIEDVKELLLDLHDDWARRVLDRTLGREDKSCK